VKLAQSISLLLACLSCVAVPSFAAGPAIEIHADKTTAKISPNFYGLMTEEINYSYDGGLYGELIRNRAFKDAPTPVRWDVATTNGGNATISLDTAEPLNAAMTTSLKLDASALSAGQVASISNEGYWGIPVRPSSTYRASVTLRASAAYAGPLTVAIVGNDGKVYAKATLSDVPTAWKKFDVDLTTDAALTPTADAKFVISTASPAVLNFAFVSLFPTTYNNRPNGNRVDIMQKLVDMKPTFLRFPGGNYLEGNTFDERFDWKKTLGPITDRPGHKSPWGYRSTDGMGLLEFLVWTEEMHAESVLAVFAGYALHKDYVPAGPKLQPYVDEALEEIEYVTGDASTKWGARRVADGHPAPFPLKYVEIGNEDWFDKSGSYDGRYAQFYDAIKAKYPDLELIATTKVKGHKIDVLDEHYYMDAHTAQRAAHKYDNRPRDGSKVFVGEWATREGAPTTNLNAALADAAFLTGMERNADVVIMSCYAPLFVNVNKGGMQWPSDLIGYDALTSYGSPSYYVQKVFNTHLGDAVVQSSISGVAQVAPAAPPPSTRPNARKPDLSPIDQLYCSVTKDSATGTLYLKVVNVSDEPTPVHITLAGISPAPTAQAITISGNPKDTNTLTDPEKILPVTSTVEGIAEAFDHPFPAHSVTVLKITAK
jgi:alpha-N-arabinofuranosidase